MVRNGVWRVAVGDEGTHGSFSSRLAAVLELEAPADASPGAITAHMASKRSLLLLEDCDREADSVATLGSRLIGDCAGVRVLATAQGPVGLPGEVVLPLASLQDETSSDSAESRDSRPLEASFAALTADLRQLLFRLSVFPGGFDLEAAVAVAGDDGALVAAGLAELAARSLVAANATRAPHRVALPEVVRRSAAENLAQSGEARAVAAAHLHHTAQMMARLREDALRCSDAERADV
jgi:predicted ATPase